MPIRKKINTIQLLRGLAAIAVVLHHVAGYLKESNHLHFLGGYCRIGFAGVDLFFVISGFIIHFTSKSYLNTPSKLGEYWKKRTIRVYPIYWIVTTGIFFFQFLLPLLNERAALNTGYPMEWLEFVKTYLLLPVHFAINPVSWTLSYELFFYLMFSLLIISKRLWVVPAGVLLFSAWHIFVEQYQHRTFGYNYYNFFFSSYNIEFFLGYLLFIVYDKGLFSMPTWLAWLGVACSLGMIISFGYGVVDGDYYKRFVIFGLTSVLLLHSLLKLEEAQQLTIHPLFIVLGDASYIIYLIHFPLIFFMNKLLLLTHIQLSNQGLINYSYLIVLVIMGLGVLLHKYLEVPMNTYLMQISSRLKTRKSIS